MIGHLGKVDAFARLGSLVKDRRQGHLKSLIAKGRDIECLTLAKAVGYFLERRVFLHANRTVVL